MENMNEVLKACCTAIGRAMYPNVDPKKAVGSKVVGPMLRPELEVAKAQGWLLDCLSDSRTHKLSIEQVMFILRKAKDVGFHDGMAYFCGDVGYTMGQPVKVEDEKAALQRDFIESTKAMAAMLARIEAISPALKVGA